MLELRETSVSADVAASVAKSADVDASIRAVAAEAFTPKLVTRAVAESVVNPTSPAVAVPTGAPGARVENSMASVVSSTSRLFVTTARA